MNGIYRFFVAVVLTSALGIAQSKTLTFCSEGDPETLSPIFNSNTTSFDVTTQIFEGLVAFKKGSTQIRPALAERWVISDDGLAYKFFLRKGVKWHSNADFKPTRDFNADDVVFSIKRQWLSDHPFFQVTSDQHPYFNDMGMKDVLADVHKVDDYTVEFRLKKPIAPLLANLAMPWANIYSAEYAEAMLRKGQPQRIDEHPIGTGPFQLESYIKNDKVEFKAFDDYWNGRSEMDRLTFLILANSTKRLSALQSDLCQIMAYPRPLDLPEIMRNPKYKLLSQTGLNVGYLAYNTEKGPFVDVRVRRALNMAINKKKILRTVYNHTAVPAVNPFPPIQWSYNRDIDDDEYNPSRALSLLAEAGYPNGFKTELWAMSVSRPYMPDAIAVANIIKEDFAEIGVEIEIKTPDWAGYAKGLQAGGHQMALYGWTSDNGDPDNFLNTLLSCQAVKGNNVAKFCHSLYNDLVIKANQTFEIDERTRLYERAQKIFKMQAPWFTIAHATQFKAVRADVVGYELSPMGSSEFYGVSFKSP